MNIFYTRLGILVDRMRKYICSFNYNAAYISYSEMLKKKKSEKVFIIGSGASINRFTEEQRKEIINNDSICLNYGMMYGISSTFHIFELAEKGHKMTRNGALLNNIDLYHKKNPSTYILLQAGVKGKSIIDLLDSSQTQYVKLIENLFMPIKNPRKIKDCIIYTDNLKNRLNINDRYLYFTKRASIFSAIQIAKDLGYKKIVLCGVELNNDNYYYEELREEYESEGYAVPTVNHSKNGIHKTNDKSVGSITVQELIEIYNESILKPNNIDLYVALNNSVLVPAVEVYWNDK